MFTKFSQKLGNPLKKIKQKIQDISQKVRPVQRMNITEIIDKQIYHIEYPTQNNISSLLQAIKQCKNFQIWNLSEYPYSEQILVKLIGQIGNTNSRQTIFNLTFQYFANIPFCEMIKAIQNIESFLRLDTRNKVFIHCQQNKKRSAVFLSSYSFLTGIQTDIAGAIMSVNRILGISMEERLINNNSQKNNTNPQSQIAGSTQIYKSQHLILKNLMNFINNKQLINKTGWILKKILINNCPKLDFYLGSSANVDIKPNQTKLLLQIRSISGIIYKKIFTDQFIEEKSLCIKVPPQTNIVLKDDFLIIVKYVYEKKGYSILRTQLNTNFIYDQYFRVNRQDMDLSGKNVHSKNENIFMDLLLMPDSSVQSELSTLNIFKDTVQDIQNTKDQTVTQVKAAEQPQIDDDFKILDEEQEAEHNLKMQQQIQEQLARQLQSIKNKTKQLEPEDINNHAQQTHSSQDYEHIVQKQQPIIQKEQNVQEQQKDTPQEQHQTENQPAHQDEQDDDDSELSEEQDDLDNYLQNLQKQADNS